MINILIVEDEQDYIDEIIGMINEIVAHSNCDIAKNKDEALQAIKSNFYDLILLDLRIPSSDGTETDSAHGYQVLSEARVIASGTPIIVLTGSSAEEFIPTLMAQAEKQDVWGEGTLLPMIAFHQKHKLDSFPQLLSSYILSFEELNNIELIKNNIELTIPEDRLIRIFTRKRNGSKCYIFSVKGGLSGTAVYRLKVTNTQGEILHLIICKIGLLEEIKKENINYETHILRLGPDATPRKIAVLEYGAKNISGIFYSLADGYEKNVFDYVADNQTESLMLLRSIQSLTHPWLSRVESRRTIKEVRKRLLSDEDFEVIYSNLNLNWIKDFERIEIQTRWCCGHGDLHGLNVLLSNENIPLLIDYGDVGDGAAALDPITLELSLFFHPKGCLNDSPWPTPIQAKSWGRLDLYLEECPYPDFIKSCRDWALQCAAGQREVAATAYAYVIRQLKYPDTNRDRALALLEGIKLFYDQT